MDNLNDSLAAQCGLFTELISVAVEPTLQELGVTYTTFELLSAVRSAGEDATQGQIAERLGVRPPSLTDAVQRASRLGLLEQTVRATDQRTKSLRLTAKGEHVVREVVRAVQSAEGHALRDISLGDRMRLRNALQKVNKSLAKSLQTHPVDPS